MNSGDRIDWPALIDSDDILVRHLHVGLSTHDLAHALWDRGIPDLARRSFEIASWCEIAEADDDLLELRLTKGRRVASCVDAAAPRSRRLATVVSRLTPRPVRAVGLVAAAVALIALAAGALLDQPTDRPSVVAERPSSAPTPADLRDRAALANFRKPSRFEMVPRASTSKPRTASPPPKSKQSPRSEVFGTVNDEGRQITAIVPVSTGRRGLITLRPTQANSRFTATLWSPDSDCDWEFSATNKQGTRFWVWDPDKVAAERQMPVSFYLGDEPFLLAAVTGARPDRCLLVDHDFTPQENDVPETERPAPDPDPSPPRPSLHPSLGPSSVGDPD